MGNHAIEDTGPCAGVVLPSTSAVSVIAVSRKIPSPKVLSMMIIKVGASMILLTPPILCNWMTGSDFMLTNAQPSTIVILLIQTSGPGEICTILPSISISRGLIHQLSILKGSMLQSSILRGLIVQPSITR